MLILPPGHGQETARRRQFTVREKRMIRAILLVVGVLVVVTVIGITQGDKKSGHGCIAVSLPYSTGGAQINKCGAAARSLCRGVNGPGLTGSAGQILAVQCRKADLPVGRS
jgi:hypothetical protein